MIAELRRARWSGVDGRLVMDRNWRPPAPLAEAEPAQPPPSPAEGLLPEPPEGARPEGQEMEAPD